MPDAPRPRCANAPRPAAAAIAILGALALVTGCGGGGHSSGVGARSASPPARIVHASVAARRAVPTAIDPGFLPQTAARPTTGRAFGARMAVLWSAIVRDAPSAARPVFFPEAAYRRIKAIGNPDGDFRYRIWAIFSRDVAAAHRLLGHRAADARLVGVDAAPGAAGWVPPGVCENAVGYWHLPGTRLVYGIGRTRYSVGVNSMISWRGVWYPIHLGTDTTPRSPGTLDDPRVGPGTPGAGARC